MLGKGRETVLVSLKACAELVQRGTQTLLSSGPWLELSLSFLSVITLVMATVSKGSYED